MTGWGQNGPLAHTAGHDLNYISVAGALHGLGQDADRPHFPSNLLGDFGGGSTYLVIGVLAALLEARSERAGAGRGRRDRGRHRAPDAMFARHSGAAASARSGAQRTCSTAARRSTTSTRPPTAGTCASAPSSPSSTPCSSSSSVCPTHPTATTRRSGRRCAPRSSERFKERTQAEWGEVFDGTDACVAPVLPLTEAAEHPHLKARHTYVDRDGVLQPAPAPRFSRTEPSLTTGPSAPGGQTREALTAWGVEDVDALLASGAAVQGASE